MTGLNWAWLVLLLAFLGLEGLALLNRKDRLEPATYWLRKVLMLHDRWAPLYWLAVGLWLWLGVHFLIDG